MSKLVVINHLTLDGVMQSPGRPDEDRRGGFAHGGWSPPEHLPRSMRGPRAHQLREEA
jgi:hypothetical protein